MRPRNTGAVSSIPPCFTLKMPLVRKTTVNPLMNSTALEKTQSLSLVSAALELEYAMQMVWGWPSGSIVSSTPVFFPIVLNAKDPPLFKSLV